MKISIQIKISAPELGVEEISAKKAANTEKFFASVKDANGELKELRNKISVSQFIDAFDGDDEYEGMFLSANCGDYTPRLKKKGFMSEVLTEKVFLKKSLSEQETLIVALPYAVENLKAFLIEKAIG